MDIEKGDLVKWGSPFLEESEDPHGGPGMGIILDINEHAITIRWLERNETVTQTPRYFVDDLTVISKRKKTGEKNS
jgi:hypothetical protein